MRHPERSLSYKGTGFERINLGPGLQKPGFLREKPVNKALELIPGSSLYTCEPPSAICRLHGGLYSRTYFKAFAGWALAAYYQTDSYTVPFLVSPVPDFTVYYREDGGGLWWPTKQVIYNGIKYWYSDANYGMSYGDRTDELGIRLLLKKQPSVNTGENAALELLNRYFRNGY